MKVLDLFCGAGGAGMGLHRAGFEVVGVDIRPQPNYPFEFHQADAVTFPLDGFDFIWASPPCQAHTTLAARHQDRDYPCFIEATRARLRAAGVPYVIENVVGAPLIHPIQLCGSSFGLKVRRHRLFEASFPILALPCAHEAQGQPIDVSGTGARRVKPRTDGKGGNPNKPRNLAEAREAMGIDWMSRKEISQAIPPAYSQFIGIAAKTFICLAEVIA
jgi:DNA (cytosine-5)-methyltransferase 1